MPLAVTASFTCMGTPFDHSFCFSGPDYERLVGIDVDAQRC